jgi:hypothetical protein
MIKQVQNIAIIPGFKKTPVFCFKKQGFLNPGIIAII